jgi:hypothetical protein
MCACGTAADTADTTRISMLESEVMRQTAGSASAATVAASAGVRAS